MKLPLVSVVITTFNHERFIAECLDSVLSQKASFPFEILVGEDDSTDDTREIVRQYEQRYPDQIRVFYRSHSDKLVINGRLTGRFNFIETMKEAKGKYIATLDGDDYWISRDKLTRQVAVLEENSEISVCHHGVQHIDENGKMLDMEFVTGKQIATIVDVAAGKVAVLQSTRVFRTSHLKLPNWFYKTSVGDIPLTLITSDKGSIFCIEEKLSAYRVHASGLHQRKSNIDKLKSFQETWGVIQENLPYFKSDIQNEVEQKMFVAHFKLAKCYYRQGDIRNGWSQQYFLVRNAKLSPRRWLYVVKPFVDCVVGLASSLMSFRAIHSIRD